MGVTPQDLRAAADLLETYQAQGTVDQLREMRGENARLKRRVEELTATVDTQWATINRLNRALDEQMRERRPR